MRYLLILLLANALATDSFLAQQIDKYSKEYLGKPYDWNSLGEGHGIDPRPLYRFDRFNCTTYVETVLGKSLAENTEDFEQIMKQIRYQDGIVDFLHRNHFPSNDWIRNNEKIGLVTDLTEQLYPEHALILKTEIDKKTWFKQTHNMDVDFPVEMTEVPYVPADKILTEPTLLDRIPSGTVFNLVRPNWKTKDRIGTDLDISHQGILIRKSDGVLYIRHARSPQHGVVEQKFTTYLRQSKSNYTEVGVNILGVNRLPESKVNQPAPSAGTD